MRRIGRLRAHYPGRLTRVRGSLQLTRARSPLQLTEGMLPRPA